MEEGKLTTMERVLLNHLAGLLADSRRIEENKDSNYYHYVLVHDEEKEDEFFELVNEFLSCFDCDVWADDIATYKKAKKLSSAHYKNYTDECMEGK